VKGPIKDQHRIYYLSVTRVLQECYKSVTRVLQGCYKGVTRVLQECYKSVTRVSHRIDHLRESYVRSLLFISKITSNKGVDRLLIQDTNSNTASKAVTMWVYLEPHSIKYSSPANTVWQRCCESGARVLQEGYESITRVLQECYKSVTRVLQGCNKSVTRVLQE
jgi:hypothetical protein